MTIQQLRELKAKKYEAAKALHAKEDFSAEDQAAFDAIMAEIDAIDKRIANTLKMEGLADASNIAAVAATAGSAALAVQVDAKPVYRNIGEQMLDVRAMTLDNAESPKARERFQQVMNAAGASTGIDSEGGYLVETDKAASIMETAVKTGVLSSRCTRQPISANADSFSYMAADDRDRSTGKMNGIQVYRKAEAETLTSSGKSKLKERELRVEDMYGLVYVTNRMLRDAVAMAEYTKRMLRSQLSWKLDYEIWQGTGVGQCLGIIPSDLVVSVAKVAAQAADTIVAGNITTMMTRFYGDISKAAWFVNQDTLGQFPLMVVGQMPVFVPGGSFANAPFGSLYGIPIVPIEFCETLGDKGDIVLGDFSEYLLIEKGSVEEAESIHVKFLTDETAYRFIVRNNGQPIHDAPITPLKGANALSPFVTLDART
jgi:HK97 family phage major capsid protein